MTGASFVIVFDHTLRTNKNMGKDFSHDKPSTAAGAVFRIHSDYSSNSAPKRFKEILSKENFSMWKGEKTFSDEEIEKLMKKRYAFFNLWRSIKEEPV